MIKKYYRLAVLFLTVLLVIGLGACSSQKQEAPKETAKQEAPKQEAPKQEPAKEVRLRIPGSVMGGTFYIQSGAIADLINRKLPGVTANAEASPGGHDNLRLVNSGADLALTNNMAAFQGLNGLPPFQEKLTKVRSIAWANPSHVHFVVTKKSNIKSINDVKGKSFCPGNKGSGEMVFKEPLEALGITYDKFSRVEYMPFSESSNAFKNGRLDVLGIAVGYPSSNVQELAASMDLSLISFSDAEIKQIADKLSYFYGDKIPGNTYKGIPNEVQVPVLGSVLMCNIDLPEDLVYKITKLLYENISELAKTSHPAFATWRFDPTIDKILPLHPGAKKYYQEKGLLK